MLKKQSDPALFGEMPSDVWFHYPDSNDNQMVEMTSGLLVEDGFPPRVLELNDVFVVPGASNKCLYDNRGQRIAESCLRRGKDNSEYVGADNENVKLPNIYTNVSTPLLYLAFYISHWGHFLTESINRLWARYAHPELRNMDACFAGFSQWFNHQANAVEFLRATSAEPLNLMRLHGAARIEKCFVPMASFTHKHSAYSAHLISARHVAESMLGNVKREHSNQPVYFSRSNLISSTHHITNEIAIDNILSKHGVKIVHPQELSLKEQIILVNKHKTLIGCWGSAFHNMVFALVGQGVTTHVLTQSLQGDYLLNYLLMDAIVGNTSHYVPVLRHEAGTGLEPHKPVVSIDIDLAIEYFREAGII